QTASNGLPAKRGEGLILKSLHIRAQGLILLIGCAACGGGDEAPPAAGVQPAAEVPAVDSMAAGEIGSAGALPPGLAPVVTDDPSQSTADRATRGGPSLTSGSDGASGAAEPPSPERPAPADTTVSS